MGPQITITPASPHSEDALHCIEAYFRELDARFEPGFDPFASGYAEEADLACFLILRERGRPVGCGAVRLLDEHTGEIKQMWIAPELRGMGLSSRLLRVLEREARELGLTKMRLDTHHSLVEAEALYRKAGYAEIDRYNDNPYADLFFEKTLKD